MVLELHVWGPAFSLPSIEAQCLATIAYFSLAVPKDAWVLIASSDPSVSPTSMLNPMAALRLFEIAVILRLGDLIC
jgi:sorting and assembly machinery component 37